MADRQARNSNSNPGDAANAPRQSSPQVAQGRGSSPGRSRWSTLIPDALLPSILANALGSNTSDEPIVAEKDQKDIPLLQRPKDRVFKNEPATVTVGFISGDTKVGTLKEFRQFKNNLPLVLPTKQQGEGHKDLKQRIPTKDLSYVAFHKKHEITTRISEGALREYDIHLPGGKKFTVETEPSLLTDPVGFYAFPVSKFSLYEEIFFYKQGLNGVEDKEPLGSMMVRTGAINNDALEIGVSEQTVNQNAPIGQILVEQNSVTTDDVDKATQHQASQQRRGKPMRLGEVLVEAGIATDEDISAALREQKKRKGKRLGEVLVELGIVKEEDVSQTLAKKFHLDFINLDDCEINSEAIGELPLDLIRRYRVFPYQSDQNSIHIAFGDPLAMETIDMLRFSVTKRIVEVIVMPSQLEHYIRTYVEDENSGSHSEVQNIIKEITELGEEGLTEIRTKDFGEEGDDDTAVARLVNRVIIDAFRRGASDIHIEPYGKNESTVIRFRIDGACENYQKVPSSYRKRLVARIKVMADLDITERRKPQDGKIRFRVGKKLIELRVATLPTVAGNEDAVLRILASGEPMPLDAMKLSPYNRKELQTIVERPYGLILVVGPTGSGKTTTLHSMLGEINQEHRKIWTAEDPVEITQWGLRQVQVNSKIGFTFAAAMRAFLRADPDVIMVGEMRDLETASTGVEASLTGHLVLSTLHTNSAPETVTRLVDMGLDPFSFGDALLGVLAQRLAKRLCPECKEEYLANVEELEAVTRIMGAEYLNKILGSEPLKLWRATGCDRCNGKGYKGRLGVHELLINAPKIRDVIQRKGTVDEIFELAVDYGMKTLLQDGVEKCLQGLTDLKQAMAGANR